MQFNNQLLFEIYILFFYLVIFHLFLSLSYNHNYIISIIIILIILNNYLLKCLYISEIIILKKLNFN